LFCDFSAYTETAIGIALMFGLLLPENFRRPYAAANLRDFWRRWHITLSNFVRDYLYIPLGGSRAGTGRYVFATMAAMGICGLWHGVGLVICRGWQSLNRPLPWVAGWAITMLFVMAGWVLFRAADFGTAASVLTSLAGGHGLSGGISNGGLMIIGAAVSLFLPSAYEIMNSRPLPWPSIAIGLAMLACFCVLEVGRGPPLSFIYFRF